MAVVTGVDRVITWQRQPAGVIQLTGTEPPALGNSWALVPPAAQAPAAGSGTHLPSTALDLTLIVGPLHSTEHSTSSYSTILDFTPLYSTALDWTILY